MMIKNIEKYKNHNVTKANKLTEEAMHRLNTQEMRLIAFMCGEINPEDTDFKSYIFNIKDLKELLGIKSNNYHNEIKKVTRNLISKTLSIPEPDGLLQISWLSSAKYYDKKGYVELSFDPKLKPYLLRLKKCFTSYKLDNVIKLRSRYAFRLYEMFKKNELLGIVKYPIKFLRERFMLKPSELKQWIDFKRYCIEAGLKEINKKTDLKVSYKPIKEFGRAYTHIIFYITKREKPKILEDKELQQSINTLIKLMPEKEQKKKTIKTELIRAYKKHGFEYCKRNIEYANVKATDNYRVFLIKALKEDWALGWWEDKIQEQKQKQEQEKQKQQEYQKFLERIKPYIGKNVRIATISALVGVLQKDGSLKIETSKGDRIISGEEIQKFLRENDVIEEWDKDTNIKENKEENTEENKKINVKYTINAIKNKKVKIEDKVYSINEDGSVTTEKETITRGRLFVMLCANMAKLLE